MKQKEVKNTSSSSSAKQKSNKESKKRKPMEEESKAPTDSKSSNKMKKMKTDVVVKEIQNGTENHKEQKTKETNSSTNSEERLLRTVRESVHIEAIYKSRDILIINKPHGLYFFCFL